MQETYAKKLDIKQNKLQVVASNYN